MLTPAAKRRRAEAASATLSQPFRSPAVRRGGALRVTSPKASQTTHYDTETRSATIPTASSSVASSKVEELTAASSPERIHKQRRPSSRLKETGIEIEKPVEEKPPFSLDSLVDQFCFDLDAGHKILEDARISDNQQKQTTTRTRKEPDGQGSKDSKDSNEELRQLIVRWKEAGRLAADELYSIISDRVTAVGGVKAWRAMSLSQPQEDSIISQKNARRRRRSREDDGGENDGQDEEENDYEDEEEKDEETDDKAEESQDFTMATMLASMGVDLDLLGYDETEEGWKG